MNILHMKYAVETAKLGSLSKAAESLIIAQPNLSRSIKELEADLGITIFNRSPKGMVLTPEGEEFVQYAQSILKQIDEVELLYKQGAVKKQKFSVSVPRASYISEAFASFIGELGEAPAEIFYKETNSQQTIQNVLNNDYNLGVIRYPVSHDAHYKTLLEEKGMEYEMVAEFSYVLLMSRENPLAVKKSITFEDLPAYIEIVHADPAVASLPLAKSREDERPDNVSRRIYVFDRASQFDVLSANPNTFMWVSSVSEKLLNAYGLVARTCADSRTVHKDVLIHREGYRLSSLDKKFITALCIAKRNSLN